MFPEVIDICGAADVGRYCQTKIEREFWLVVEASEQRSDGRLAGVCDYPSASSMEPFSRMDGCVQSFRVRGRDLVEKDVT